MKISSLLLILFFNLNFYTYFANGFRCQGEGFYPDPNDCAKFYRCAHGQQYSFDCGPGTHYNPMLMVCDWPYNSRCSQSQPSPVPEFLESEPIGFTNSPTAVEWARVGRQSNGYQTKNYSPATTSQHFVTPSLTTYKPLPHPFTHYQSPSQRIQQSPTINQPRDPVHKKPSFENEEFYEYLQSSSLNPEVEATSKSFTPLPSERIRLQWPHPKNQRQQKNERLTNSPLVDQTSPNGQNLVQIFKPSTLYYDPTTGIYHQFHYTRQPDSKKKYHNLGPKNRQNFHNVPNGQYQQQNIDFQPQFTQQQQPMPIHRRIGSQIPVVPNKNRYELENNKPKTIQHPKSPKEAASGIEELEREQLTKNRYEQSNEDELKEFRSNKTKDNDQIKSYVIYEDEQTSQNYSSSTRNQKKYGQRTSPLPKTTTTTTIKPPSKFEPSFYDNKKNDNQYHTVLNPNRTNPKVNQSESRVIYSDEHDDKLHSVFNHKISPASVSHLIQSNEPQSSITTQARKYPETDDDGDDNINDVKGSQKSARYLSLANTTDQNNSTLPIFHYEPPLKQSIKSVHHHETPTNIRLTIRELSVTDPLMDSNQLMNETNSSMTPTSTSTISIEDEPNNSESLDNDKNVAKDINQSELHDKLRKFIESFNLEQQNLTTTISPISPEENLNKQLTDELARLIGLQRREANSKTNSNKKNYGEYSWNSHPETIPECEESSWEKVCLLRPEVTGSNFDWLQLQDEALKQEQTKLIQTKHTDSLDDCQQYCWRMIRDCIGFTYDRIDRQCHLVYEIDLESLDSLENLLNTHRENSTTNFLKRQPRSITGLLKPELNLGQDQMLIAQNLVPAFVKPFLEDDQIGKDRQQILQLKNDLYGISDWLDFTGTFFECLNQCRQRGALPDSINGEERRHNCQYAIHHQLSGLCLIKQQTPWNTEIKTETDSLPVVDGALQQPEQIKNGRFEIRSGWQIAFEAPSTDDKKEKLYIEENKPVFVRMFEQYLIDENQGKGKKLFLGRYLQPKRLLENVTSVQQCQYECNLMDQCKFIAIYENALQSEPNFSEKSCLLFQEDLIELLFKLMVNEQEDQTRRQAAASEDSEAFVPYSSSALFTILPPVRRKKKNVDQNSMENYHDETNTIPQQGLLEMKAYVFDTYEPYLKFRIDHHKTINDSLKMIHPPFQEWEDVEDENRCFQHCSNSWLIENTDSEAFNSIFNGIQMTPCRFLVIKSFSGSEKLSFNCSFYELSPIAFTEQTWFTVNKLPTSLPEFPSSSLSLEGYFHQNQSQNNDDDVIIRLMYESTSDNRDKCLWRCLQTLMSQNESLPTTIAPSMRSGKHCFQVHIGRFKSGKFKCRFYERFLMNDEDQSGLPKVYRLVHLPLDPLTLASKPMWYGQYLDYFQQLSDHLIGTNESILNLYEPLYVLNGETNPNNCLRLCVLLWGRVEAGHDEPGRCRLVFAQPEQPLGLIEKAKYSCMIYDLDLEHQLKNEENFQIKIKFQNDGSSIPMVEIYSRTLQPENLTSSDENHRPIKTKLLMKLDLRDFQMNLNRSWSTGDNRRASYHFSNAGSAQECTRRRLPRHNYNNNNNQSLQHQLIIAKPIFINDPILPSRIVVKFECLFFDDYPVWNWYFADKGKNEDQEGKGSNDDGSIQLAYRLIDVDTYDYVDANTETIRFIRKAFQPIMVIGDNSTKTVQDCLRRCSEFNYYYHQQQTFEKFVQCQLVWVKSNRIIQNTTQDYHCELYNFNVSSRRGSDLEPIGRPGVEYYRLRSPPIITGFQENGDQMEHFERINHTDQIERISRTIVDPPGRQAFVHLSNISDPKQCLDRCLRTWESRLLYYNNPSLLSRKAHTLIQSHFCRLVIVIPTTLTHKQKHNNQQQFECAFYETNFTRVLKSFQVSMNSSKFQIEPDYLSSEDHLYMSVEWPLVSPQASDHTMMLSRPVNMEHCLMECDRKTMHQCQAIVSRYEHNRLVKCYFIGQREYIPDYQNRPLPNHQSKISIKLFAIRHPPMSYNGPWKKQKKINNNPYLAMIDSLRNYQQKQIRD